MRLEEFDAFKREMQQLCATLGKKYSDALAQAYWRSLRDIELDELQAHVERILLNANSETEFPRPSHLRTTPPARASAGLDPKLREGEDVSMRFLERWRKEDPNWWMQRMEGTRAAEHARQFGVHNIWYDFDERGWRHHP